MPGDPGTEERDTGAAFVFVLSAESAGCRATSRSATSPRTSSPVRKSSRCTLLGGRSGDCTAGDCAALGSEALGSAASTAGLGDRADVCGGSTGAGAACTPDRVDVVEGCAEGLDADGCDADGCDADGCDADVVVTGAPCVEGGGVMVAEVSAGEFSADGCGGSSVGTGGVCAVTAAAAVAAAGAEPRMRVERGCR